MLIDWFTVGAQALNFFVLVWLLKRFLYQPVLDAIAGREALIARQIDDAAAVRREADTERQVFEQKSQAFEAERAGLLDQAVRGAQAERERLVAAAHLAAEDLSAKRQEALRSAAAQSQQALAEGVRREVFEITRRVLADLASAGLEERLAEVFVRRLTELDEAARQRLAAVLATPGAHVLVRSAFVLPDPARAAIEHALRACAGAEVPIEFACAPELVCGIELLGAGQKLAWSIDQYLDALERTMAELLLPARPLSTASTAVAGSAAVSAAVAAGRP